MIRDPTRVISSLNPISDDEEWSLCSWEEEEESCFEEGSYLELFHGDNLRNLPALLWMSRPVTNATQRIIHVFKIFLNALVPAFENFSAIHVQGASAGRN